ncbi:GbsR/MarR family transcriptional regulator [Occultella kanbiaonis]|uniref:GbsR/MarR family transcriptional regulator n=1 Tax=Occultella kanbiaonis TaxID=2675754 RepID=UPI001B3548EC|nr:helix-turn-helix domain-containing protein [Occultella kanbiaonis]
MASRVFASLITSMTATVSAADLVRELDVSPASVSKAISYLEAMELVVRQPEPGRRRERYSIRDDVWTQAIRADSSGHASVADAAQRGLALFGTDTQAGIRLARMGEFFGNLASQLRGNDLADPGVDDAMTVVAALGHGQRPMTPQELATALSWPTDRIHNAIRLLQHRPALSDPFVVSESDAGHALEPRSDRLSTEQRAMLRGD